MTQSDMDEQTSPAESPADNGERGPWQWSCGHTAMAICLQCHQALIQRANALAAENAHLREALEHIAGISAGIGGKARNITAVATIAQLLKKGIDQ